MAQCVILLASRHSSSSSCPAVLPRPWQAGNADGKPAQISGVDDWGTLRYNFGNLKAG